MLLLKSLLSGFLVAAFVVSPALPSSGQETDKTGTTIGIQRLQESITSLLQGKGDWTIFSVTYDDIHGLHGGMSLTISGTGKVSQSSVRRPLGEAKEVSAEELRGIVELLVKHQAWVQKEPARMAVPDESMARLTVANGSDSVTIWEWYNDLGKNNRVLEIREAMQKAAWK